MTDLIINGNTGRPSLPLPRPRVEADIRIRPGVLSDYDFLDDLQKRHKHGVGFMWEAAIKGHLEKGNVLVAEAIQGAEGSRGPGAPCEAADGSSGLSLGPLAPDPSAPPRATPVGYVLGVDRYLKRDELGIIYQMNVEPAYQRSLVAANLLQAKFEASAYGCRLYCCWCAQDLSANHFWESMGFVPLAFRTGGGRGKTRKDGQFRGRMHIFWQKRIREGDTGDPARGGTPYWFPGVTGAGAIGEDRLVLPIPPGTHWSDAKPIVLPESARDQEEVKLLEDEVARLEREKKALQKGLRGQGLRGAVAKVPKPKPTKQVAAGGLRFGPPGDVERAANHAADAQAKRQAKERAAAIDAELKVAKQTARRAKRKFDPAQVAFARELKDRWLEQVQAQPELLALPPQSACGSHRYDVRRALPAPQGVPESLRHLGGERDAGAIHAEGTGEVSGGDYSAGARLEAA